MIVRYLHTKLCIRMSEHWKIIFLMFSIFGEPTSASIGNYLPFSGKRPIPAKTPEPVSITTRQTYPLFIPKPLTFKGNYGRENAYLRNTGTVDLMKSNTTNVLTGGPLYKNTYVYTETKFYWTNNTDKAAYTTVNGEQGSALEVAVIYYNTKYESHYEALKYRDGIAEVLYRINIGSKFNPKFEPFAAAVTKILKPGPPVEIKLRDTFSWFYDFPRDIRYFTFPGSQTNETLDEMFYCTTTMAVDLIPTQYISKKQFEKTFLKFVDDKGDPLTNQAQQHPLGSRPVARLRGIIKIFSNKLYKSII